MQEPQDLITIYLRIKEKIQKDYPYLPEEAQNALIQKHLEELEEYLPPIPQKKQEKIVNVTPSLSYESQPENHEFYQMLSRNYKKTSKALPFVSNESPNIYLENWSKKQQKYYFYWRSKVREGTFLRIDETYLYLYCIELLYGIGYDQPQKCFEDYLTILKHYSDDFPYINEILLSWAFDFALIHNMDLTMFVTDFPITPPFFCYRNLLLYNTNNENFQFPPQFLFPLADFYVSKSKIDLDMLSQATCNVINHLHKTVVVKNKKGFLDNFSTAQKKTESITLFSDIPGIEVETHTFPTKNYCTNKRFILNITEILRLTENTLRGFQKIRGRLQNIKLEPDLQTIIVDFLDEHYNPNYIPKKAPPPEKLTLDFHEINNLRDQSDAVRAALEVEEVQKETPPPVEKPKPKKKPKSKKEPSSLSQPWQDFLDALGELEKQALLLLSTNPTPQTALQQLAEEHFTMIEPLMEEINNQAAEHLSDIILEMQEDTPIILDEYQEQVTQCLPFLS